MRGRFAFLIGAFLAVLMMTLASAQSVNSTGECNEEDAMTFEGWSEWAQVTQKPIVSEGHNNNWVGIYVDELAKDTYLSAGAPYPECAKIVKPIYFDAEGKSVRKLTIMVKMKPGYDPDNGDWWYAHSDASGTQIGRHGRLHGCIPCHKQAAETDYLFSKDVLNALKE
jgi:hypothetical protein